MKSVFQYGDYYANFETAFFHVLAHVLSRIDCNDCDTDIRKTTLLDFVGKNRIKLNAYYQLYFKRQDWLCDFITLVYKNVSNIQMTLEEYDRFVSVYWCVGENKELSKEFNIDISFLKQ